MHLHSDLRSPGPHFDAETGKHYNYFRDYDPQIGRYLESDPIGLYGGLNTFGYVNAQPLILIDRLGLAECRPCTPEKIAAINKCIAEAGVTLDHQISVCLRDMSMGADLMKRSWCVAAARAIYALRKAACTAMYPECFGDFYGRK